MIVWRAGLSMQEALALAEGDLDQRGGALLVGRGKGGRRRAVGIDGWGWEELQPWLDLRLGRPVGPLLCVFYGRTRGRHWSSAAARANLRRTAARRACAGALRRRLRTHENRFGDPVCEVLAVGLWLVLLGVVSVVGAVADAPALWERVMGWILGVVLLALIAAAATVRWRTVFKQSAASRRRTWFLRTLAYGSVVLVFSIMLFANARFAPARAVRKADPWTASWSDKVRIVSCSVARPRTGRR